MTSSGHRDIRPGTLSCEPGSRPSVPWGAVGVGGGVWWCRRAEGREPRLAITAVDDQVIRPLTRATSVRWSWKQLAHPILGVLRMHQAVRQ